MKPETGEDDKSIEEMDEEQRQAEISEENAKGMLEEELNEKALKIGRKVLDEIYLHSENRIEVIARRSSLFGLDIIEVGVHQITGLLGNEVEFIMEGNLKERITNLKTYQGIAQYRRSRF